MSLKLHFMHAHLDFFPHNMGDANDEQGEHFHQLISTMEKGTWESGHLLCWQTTAGLCNAKESLLTTDRNESF